MKKTRKHIGQILDRSLAWHRNPSRSEVQSVVNRVWEALPEQESAEFGETIEPYQPRLKSPPWRLAAVAAVLVVVSVTLVRSFQSSSTRTESEALPLPPIDVTADANVDALLMDEVSAHLWRRIPAPMEPIMTLIPTQTELAQTGGTQ